MTAPVPTQILYRVPAVINTESLASWLSRLALAQGCTIHQIRKFLKIKDQDTDLFLSTNIPNTLATACNLHPDEFIVIRRVMSQLHQINENGVSFLLNSDGKPRSRYCPLCLKSDRVPYFRLEWRFNPWRWCPVHSCLLEDLCPNCHGLIRTPFNMINAGPGRSGIPTLSYCHSCGQSLLTGRPLMVDIDKEPSETRKLLTNGRAFLASLYFGYFYIKAERFQGGLFDMKRIDHRQSFCDTFLALASDSPNVTKLHAFTAALRESTLNQSPKGNITCHTLTHPNKCAIPARLIKPS